MLNGRYPTDSPPDTWPDEDGEVTMTSTERYWHALRVLDRACRAKASFGTIRAAAAQVTIARESLTRPVA